MTEGPLVSVGIPCYNRPEGLRRTLECIIGQTYLNLEIIVSDNCSPDPEVERVGRGFANKDLRVQYYRQNMNDGPMPNFQFVLEKATGEYFMWAADDDLWIFSEEILSRLRFMLDHNYGNLFYSLFRKSALYDGNEPIFNKIPTKSLNEIPLLLFVIEKGNWAVKPKIGMYKRTNLNTHQQARWEINGGKLPNVKMTRHLLSLKSAFRYHILATRDIVTTIARLNLLYYGKNRLAIYAAWVLIQHYYHLIIRRK